MELKQLRQFTVLARVLNFRRAAEQLYIAQPPLSVSIAKLEAELGVRLFERHARGVRLTPSGEAALPFAEEAVARAEDLRDVVGAISCGRRGQLRIGFIGSATYRVVPRLTAAFRKQHPDAELLLEEARGFEVLARVDSANLDLGIVRTPLLEPTHLFLAPLESSHLALAVSPNHPLYGAPSVRLEDLRDESFILYDRSVPIMRSLVLLSCQDAGFLPMVSHTAAQIHTVLSLVEMGLGIALVPGVKGSQTMGQTRLIEVTTAGRSVTVGLSLVRRPQDKSPLVRAFFDLALGTQAVATDEVRTDPSRN